MFLWPAVKRRNYLLQVKKALTTVLWIHIGNTWASNHSTTPNSLKYFSPMLQLCTQKKKPNQRQTWASNTLKADLKISAGCFSFLVQQDSMSAVGQIQSLPYETTACQRSLEVLKLEWASLLQKYKVYCTKTTNTIQLILLDNIKTLLAIL